MKHLFILLLGLIMATVSLSAQEVILKKGRYYDRSTGKPFTGTYQEFNPEKTVVISELKILNGYLDGDSKVYFPSGMLKEVRSYVKGKKEGIWTTWSEAGQKTAEASFKEGLKDGNWFVWDENGIKRYEMFYEKGEKRGTWIIRDEKDSVISRETFQ
jgi:antitoxin component YwqK of YwqJK toxin-antitoxin module